MADTDENIPRKRIAASFAKGIIFTQDDFLQMVWAYSLDELGLLAVAYGHEALAALRHPERANKRALEFIGAIHDHLSEEDRVGFRASLKNAFEGVHASDERLLRRLPVFHYELRDGELGVRLIFPDDA